MENTLGNATCNLGPPCISLISSYKLYYTVCTVKSVGCGAADPRGTCQSRDDFRRCRRDRWQARDKARLLLPPDTHWSLSAVHLL